MNAKKYLPFLWTSMLCWGVLLGSVSAQEQPGVPTRLIPVSGVLKDTLGQPLSGVQGVTFALYKDQQGGSPLWLETQNVTADEQGRYTVLLGSTQGEGLPLELFSSGEARWLGVQVNLPGATEQPRILLVSVPYALKAADADTLGGKPLSAFVLADSGASGEDGYGKQSLNTAAVSDGLTTVAVSGTGTTNQVVKWTDGASGTLGDSTITESGGNVGIGITSPSKKLEVAGTIRIATPGTDILQFVNASNGKQWTHYLAGYDMRYYEYGPNLDRLTLQGNTGNIGIGTTVPTEKLVVAGNVKASGSLTATQLVSSVATGTPPFVVNSTTQVANLNASLLGGLPASAFGDITSVTAGTGLTGGATAGDAALALSSAARVRAITYLAGCDTCDVLTDADDQNMIFFNVIGSMSIASVTCFSDAGSPTINLRREGSLANVLSSDLACSTSGATSTTFSGSENTLNLNDKLDFIMVGAGGTAKRVTVSIEAVVN